MPDVKTPRLLMPPLSELDSCHKFACVWEKYLWRLQDAGILDATVYRECPECGGIENHEGDCNACGTTGEVDGKECPNCEGTGRGPWVPCPACKDAPTAIVSAALREKAAEELYMQTSALTATHVCAEQWETAPEVGREAARQRVDAVLSTVLGRPVRYASQVIPAGEHYATLKGPKVVFDRDLAILEEAGKEGGGNE